MHVCSVAQSCPTLCNPMDSSPPGSSVHGIFQVKLLKCVAISYFNIYIYYIFIHLYKSPLTKFLIVLCGCILSQIVAVQSFNMSDSLQPYGIQHARLPYPSSAPRVCSNSCPLSQ